jgi:hypothetical protein
MSEINKSEIKLKLSLDEANLMLEALGNMPFVRVYALIAKVQEQAGLQLGPARSQQRAGVADNASGQAIE